MIMKNENIYFSISDTGCGMNKDTLKKYSLILMKAGHQRKSRYQAWT